MRTRKPAAAAAARNDGKAMETVTKEAPKQAPRAKSAQGEKTSRGEKKEATRQQLLDATIEAIAVGGFADLTLAKVSQRAKVSRGLVNFHFESKEKLLVETLQHLTNEYHGFWRKAVARQSDPAAKLLAVIAGDFHPKVCNRKKIAVFYAFWGEARSRPLYRDVSAKSDSEFAYYLEECCAEIAAEYDDPIDPVFVAKGLRCMIDGLWFELLMTPDQFDRDVSKRLCTQYLARAFPRHFTGEDLAADTSSGTNQRGTA